MAKKRVSMRGMGADAFFNPPSEEKEEPVNQDEGIPESQPTGKTTRWGTDLPVDQQISTPVNQQASVPSSQDAIIPATHDTSTPVSQQADIPVKRGLIKATYYIHPDQDLKLERIRLARRMRGDRVDKSELIREAIDKLIEQNT